MLYIIITNQKLRVMTSPAEQMMISKSCHSDTTSGHFGVTKTWRRVAEGFYWKGLVADAFYFHDTIMTLLKSSEKRIVEQILRFNIGPIWET